MYLRRSCPHSNPEKFENRDLTLKTCQTFSGGIPKRSTHQSFWVCVRLRKIGTRGSRDYRDVIVSEKLRYQNVFRPYENEKPPFSDSSGLKSFRKAPF